MINGVNPATFFILPMLGEKHPDEYPRFRDCFVTDDNRIAVYTRVGGGNRDCGYGEEELYEHPNFLTTKDDDYDCTYATYYFSIPDEFKNDFDIIVNAGDWFNKVSDAYVERLHKVYPKLKEKFSEMFAGRAVHARRATP